MSNKKTNHNHIGDLGCVPGPLLERYHKTSMVSLNSISPNMHFIINDRIMKQIYQSTQELSNIGIVHNDNHIYNLESR